MEALDQDYGFILYRTHLRGPQSGKLSINGSARPCPGLPGWHTVGCAGPQQACTEIGFEGVLQRAHGLDILVENMGRVNFGPDLLDRKGILGGVLIGWQFSLIGRHSACR